jgi:hemerythrin-like domain-containing protein
MEEHRLIERMISLIDKETDRIGNRNMVNLLFIDTAVDFLEFYADQTHHGKEEGILFRELAQKNLSEGDGRLMKELIQEHRFLRAATRELETSVGALQNSAKGAFVALVQHLRRITDIYPSHIEKEDKIFFPSSMTYLSQSEQQSILDEFREFDRKMIHAKYESIVEALEE